MKKKILRISQFLFLGILASTPILFLSSCSSEPSIAKPKTTMNMHCEKDGVTSVTTNVNDIKSSKVKNEIASICSIALSAISLNFDSSDDKDFYPIYNNENDDIFNQFKYFLGNSWITGGGPFVDKSKRISFGLKEIIINTDVKYENTLPNDKPASNSLPTFLQEETNTPPSSPTQQNKTNVLSITSIDYIYGFYDSNDGGKWFDTIGDIISRLKGSSYYQDVANFSNKPHSEYRINFNIRGTFNLIGTEKDSDWKIDESEGKEPPHIDFNSESIIPPKGSLLKKYTGSKNIADFISGIQNLVKVKEKKNIDIKNKYHGLIKSITDNKIQNY